MEIDSNLREDLRFHSLAQFLVAGAEVERTRDRADANLLLTIDSCGLLLVSVEKGILVSKVSDVEAASIKASVERNFADVPFPVFRHLDLGGRPTSMAVTSDGAAVAVALEGDSGLRFYNTVDFANGRALVAGSVSGIKSVTSLKWSNHGVDRLFVSTHAWEAKVVSLNESSETIALENERECIVCGDWRPGFDHLAVGLSPMPQRGGDTRADVVLLGPDLKELSRGAQPDEISKRLPSKDISIRNVVWLASDVVYVCYISLNEEDKDTPAGALWKVEKEGRELRLLGVDSGRCVPGMEVTPQHRYQLYMSSVPAWNTYVFASSVCTTCETMYEKSQPGGDKAWEAGETEDSYRVEVLEHEDKETYPRGMCISRNASLRLPFGDEGTPPCPLLFIINNIGRLRVYAVVVKSQTSDAQRLAALQVAGPVPAKREIGPSKPPRLGSMGGISAFAAAGFAAAAGPPPSLAQQPVTIAADDISPTHTSTTDSRGVSEGVNVVPPLSPSPPRSRSPSTLHHRAQTFPQHGSHSIPIDDTAGDGGGKADEDENMSVAQRAAALEQRVAMNGSPPRTSASPPRRSSASAVSETRPASNKRPPEKSGSFGLYSSDSVSSEGESAVDSPRGIIPNVPTQQLGGTVKAPIPFGATAAAAKPVAKSTPDYPPMSAKAPKNPSQTLGEAKTVPAGSRAPNLAFGAKQPAEAKPSTFGLGAWPSTGGFAALSTTSTTAVAASSPFVGAFGAKTSTTSSLFGGSGGGASTTTSTSRFASAPPPAFPSFGTAVPSTSAAVPTQSAASIPVAPAPAVVPIAIKPQLQPVRERPKPAPTVMDQPPPRVFRTPTPPQGPVDMAAPHSTYESELWKIMNAFHSKREELLRVPLPSEMPEWSENFLSDVRAVEYQVDEMSAAATDWESRLDEMMKSCAVLQANGRDVRWQTREATSILQYAVAELEKEFGPSSLVPLGSEQFTTSTPLMYLRLLQTQQLDAQSAAKRKSIEDKLKKVGEALPQVSQLLKNRKAVREALAKSSTESVQRTQQYVSPRARTGAQTEGANVSGAEYLLKLEEASLKQTEEVCSKLDTLDEQLKALKLTQRGEENGAIAVRKDSRALGGQPLARRTSGVDSVSRSRYGPRFQLRLQQLVKDVLTDESLPQPQIRQVAGPEFSEYARATTPSTATPGTAKSKLVSGEFMSGSPGGTLNAAVLARLSAAASPGSRVTHAPQTPVPHAHAEGDRYAGRPPLGSGKTAPAPARNVGVPHTQTVSGKRQSISSEDEKDENAYTPSVNNSAKPAGRTTVTPVKPPTSSKPPPAFNFSSVTPGSAASAAAPKAPQPTSGAKQASASSSAAYPTMSKKAPTPFSGGTAQRPPTPTPSTSGTSAAQPPPMSAPPPPSISFGAKAEEAKKETQPAAAPVPASSKGGGDGYPPMSKKAPKPFNGASTPSDAYPPLSAKPPTPFSASGSAAAKPASTESTASAKPSSSAAAYPTMSKKAPTPFGGASTNVGAAAAASTSSATPGGGGGLFGSSAKVPKPSPFGQVNTITSTNAIASTTSAFSSLSALADAATAVTKDAQTDSKQDQKATAPAPSPPPVTPGLQRQSSVSGATSASPFNLGSLLQAAATVDAPTTPPPAGAAAPRPFGGFGATSTTNSAFGSTSTSKPAFGSTSTPGTTTGFGFGPTPAPQLTPFGAQPSTGTGGFGNSTGAAAGTSAPNYEQQVRQIYEQHNPSKLQDIPNLMQKYKGNEEDMLRKLRHKYNLPMPDTTPSAGTAPTQTPSLFGNTSMTSAPVNQSPFSTPAVRPPLGGGGFFGASQGSTQQSPFGQQAPTPSPFGSMNTGGGGFGSLSTPGAVQQPMFGQPSTPGGGGFGQTSTPVAVPIGGGFGQTSTPVGGGFGQTSTTPFGSGFGGASTTQISPFGTQTRPSPFSNATNMQTQSQTSSSPFGAQQQQNLQQMLHAWMTQVYTSTGQHQQLDKLAANIEKYKGREGEMVQKLCEKYKVPPPPFASSLPQPAPAPTPAFGAQTPAFGSGGGGFGASQTPAFGTQGGGFGTGFASTPNAFGSQNATSAPTFGQPSALGSGFGSAGSTSVFGAPSTLGGGSPFGNAGGGFGQQQQVPQGGGFGAFASPATNAFGQPAAPTGGGFGHPSGTGGGFGGGFGSTPFGANTSQNAFGGGFGR